MADFEDLFNGTLDTNLTDHTPDVGTGWTGGGSTTDNARLTGNGELKAESNESVHAIWSDDLGSADQQVWCYLYATDNNINSRICLRLDGTNGYAGGISRNSFHEKELIASSRVGGSTANHGTVDTGDTNPRWVRIKAEGDTITFWYASSLPADPESDTGWTQFDSIVNSNFNTVQSPGLLLFGSTASNTDANPWLGSYYASSLSTGDTTAPTFDSASTDSAGDTVTVTFNEALDTNNDTASGEWTVDEDGSPVTINSAAIDTGNTTDVTIELASAVAEGATVTVSYSGTSLRDAAGNQVSTFTDNPVTNNVTDTTAPTLSSATVNDAALTLTYNEALDEASVPATGDFTVTGSSSGTVSVSNVGVSGTDVNLTLASAVAVGETVTLDYTPGTNPIQDTAGNDAASLTGQSVTNNTSNDLTYTTNLDSMNATEAGTSITNPGASEPQVDFTVRTQGGGWRYFYFRLNNANGKRPVFEFDAVNFERAASDFLLSRRAWYTYDDPTSLNATWTQWDSDMTNPSGDLRRFQLGTSFTQDTVYIASEPAYPVARARNLIQWFEDNHPDMLHRLPSVGDDAEWSAGTVSSQTDSDGNTIPQQPMYAFGVWDSTVYPDDNLPKRTVVLTAGHHSGEPSGNHVLDAFMQFLASSDAAAVALRKNFQFIVYPMLNPDGRYGGGCRESWEDSSIDPNRDMINQVLEMTQVFVAAFDKDFPGRTVPFHASFHADSFHTNYGGGAEAIYFYENAPAAVLTAWESALSAHGSYGTESSGITEGLRAYMENNYSTQHSYVCEHMPTNSNFTTYSEFTKNGEDTAKALNTLWGAESAGQLAYAGNYIATTLDGNATVSRKLDAAVYPWPPKHDDTPLKVERGLGADSSRNFRMDLGNITGEVFVVISSVDYESTNTNAAAGANIVTVSNA